MKRLTLIFVCTMLLALPSCERRDAPPRPAPAQPAASPDTQKAAGTAAAPAQPAASPDTQKAAGTAAAPANQPQKRYRFTMAIFDAPGNAFWQKVVMGAKEGAKRFDCDVDIQYGGNDATKVTDILEMAITNKVDGIAVTLNFDDPYDEVVRRARDLGIAVVAFNIDDTKRGEGNARMAYIGQNMETAGYQIAKRLIKDAGLQTGQFVACPVEYPEAIYAIQRYAGAKRAFDEAGIRSEVVKTGAISIEDTLNKLTQYLLGHKDANAILGMGQMPLEVSPQAAKDAGISVPNAGFDLTRQIAKHIQDGETIATIDQQPFYQGLFSIMQLYYNRVYGLAPCDIDTGGAMVDKSNVAGVAELADSVR
jgi:simple sugar transport system substrate-binding protein